MRGTLLTGEAGRVTGLDPGAPGRVHTAAGDVLAAGEIVCCAGRWTPQLTALANPERPVPLVTWGPTRLIHTPEIALRLDSGGLL